MNSQTTLLYDGSFDGFLCAIFQVYDQKIKNPQLIKQQVYKNQLFTTIEEIITEKHKAKRVWLGIKSKANNKELTIIFRAFLSEIKGIENTLLNFIHTIFSSPTNKNINYSDSSILKLTKVTKMVNREKHRMEAFVRFKLTKDNVYTAAIAPDFNVLPLITHHLKDRYADQKWILYDIKRNYGIYYNLITIELITIHNFKEVSIEHYNTNEIQFQKLWRTYFDNVNIKSRKNMKLHTQHIPKRYWKYLTEKKHFIK